MKSLHSLFRGHLFITVWFTILSLSQASEVISWNLTYSLYPSTVISGQATNGSPVATNDSGYMSLSTTLTNSSITFDPNNQNLSLGAILSGSCECLQDFWVYNQPGQNGPIAITVTPSFSPIYPSGFQTHYTLNYSLTTSQNGNSLSQQQYNFQFSSVVANNMGAFTFSVTNGDRITFDMLHQDSYGNSGINSAFNSGASYSFTLSSNGFATNIVQTNATIITNLPQITSALFLNSSHTLLAISGSGGPTNMEPYYVLSSTNPAAPMSGWTSYQTNNFTTNGSFYFLFPVGTSEPQRYVRLEIAQ